jgi:glutathione S-transferase
MLRICIVASIIAAASSFSIDPSTSRHLGRRPLRSATALEAKKKFKVAKWAEKIESGVMVDGEMTDAKVAAPPEPTVKPGALGADSMELYCKAAPDGSYGDCPHAHLVGMVLHTKGISEYELKPTLPGDKPEWLMKEHGGMMPCLVHKGEAFTESMDIAKYIDFFFPEPKLEPKGSVAHERALRVTDDFLGKIKAYLRADAGTEAEGKRALDDALAAIDSHLKKNGPYLAGDALTLSDCGFAPQLQHLVVGGAASTKNFVIPAKLTSLLAYQDLVFALPAFTASSPAASVLTAAWA